MIISRQKPILVTGSHRAGTTWVGKMIALNKNICYIHEPFSLNRKNSPLEYWFEYVSCNTANNTQVYNYLNDTINISIEQYKKQNQNILYKLTNIFFPTDICPLIKDPIALLSAEWIAKKFNASVIILIKHPAAFVNSIIKKGQSHHFNHFLLQDDLMKYDFSAYLSEIKKFSSPETELLDQGILLWKLLYSKVLYYKKEFKWMFIRWEDLAVNPIAGFEKLYSTLNLKYTKDIKETIQKHSQEQGTEKKISRRSSNEIFRWKYELSEHEIHKIFDNTYEIAKEFYPESKWFEI